MSTATTARMAASLRAAADLLAAQPHLQQPYVTSSSDGTVSINWYLNGRDLDERATAAEVIKSIDGTWARGEGYDASLATWTQHRGDVELFVQVSREQVCTRRVVGTETVVVPAVEAQPERTEVRELVEWDCRPVLGDRVVVS